MKSITEYYWLYEMSIHFPTDGKDSLELGPVMVV